MIDVPPENNTTSYIDFPTIVHQSTTGGEFYEPLSRKVTKANTILFRDCDFIHLGLESLITLGNTSTVKLDGPEIVISRGNHYSKLKSLYNERAKKIDSGRRIKADNAFSFIINYVADLNFVRCDIEITKSDSLKLSFVYPNNIILVVTKPFDEIADVSTNQIIFSLFTTDGLLASNISDIDEFFKGFKRFLQM